eukprot:364394-Chlamydomonas_euryale.AAC.3
MLQEAADNALGDVAGVTASLSGLTALHSLRVAGNSQLGVDAPTRLLQALPGVDVVDDTERPKAADVLTLDGEEWGAWDGEEWGAWERGETWGEEAGRRRIERRENVGRRRGEKAERKGGKAGDTWGEDG